MEAYQERMVEEMTQLLERTNKLNDFISSEKFFDIPKEKRVLMTVQKNAMEQYAMILGYRLLEEGININKLTY